MHDKSVDMLRYERLYANFYNEKALNLMDLYYNNKLDY